MKMILVLAALVGGLVLWSVRCAVKFGGRPPIPYRNRRCQGKNWIIAFPKSSKEDIRAFLQVFVDGFAFHDRERLRFSPEDRIMDVYRALYPHKWTGDALEMETLNDFLKERYGLGLVEVWKDNLTLGELYEACITRMPNQAL